MREWVVKLLGGVDLEKEQLVLEARADELVQQNEKLWLQLQMKDIEIQRLTNLMLTKGGFIVPEGKSEGETKHEPINARKSWRSTQRELEISDARRAADEIERRWRAKPGAVSDGGSGVSETSEKSA